MSDLIFCANSELLCKLVGSEAGEKNSSSRKIISQESYLPLLIQLMAFSFFFFDERHARMKRQKKEKSFHFSKNSQPGG